MGLGPYPAIGLSDARIAAADTRKLIAATILAEQVQDLRAEGFDQFHFYTLNQADLTFAACCLLGMRPQGIAR